VENRATHKYISIFEVPRRPGQAEQRNVCGCKTIKDKPNIPRIEKVKLTQNRACLNRQRIETTSRYKLGKVEICRSNYSLL